MITCISYAFLLLLVNLVMILTTSPNAFFTHACLGSSSSSLQVDAYQNSCPEVEAIVLMGVASAVADDPRMAASLLRLHFHDCFVNGCDASVLLDDTPSIVGEKTAGPNLNSLRGFEVIDAIKFDLEVACPETVSCADILAIAARDSVSLSGGPTWQVQMGRKDSLSASKVLANNNIPGPNSDVATLISKFQNVGLSHNDMVTLSGAHTIGRARCPTFISRLTTASDSDSTGIDKDFITSLKQLCSGSNNNATLTDLDLVTSSTFDNQYYANLLSGDGLLASDQALVTGASDTRNLVESYVEDPEAFFEDFKSAMLRMGSLKPLIGKSGEIRRNCRTVN